MWALPRAGSSMGFRHNYLRLVACGTSTGNHCETARPNPCRGHTSMVFQIFVGPLDGSLHDSLMGTKTTLDHFRAEHGDNDFGRHDAD